MKYRLVTLLVLAGFLLGSLTACAAEDPLADTSWELMAYGDAAPIAGTTMTAIFEDGQVHGSTGCNSYSGTYQVDGDRISLGPLAITEMACLEPAGLMDQETRFMELMASIRAIEFLGDQLQLSGPDGEALIFAPVN